MGWVKSCNIRGPSGEPGPPGESVAGAPGEAGATIAAIERGGSRLFVELDDGRRFDAGEVVGPQGDKGDAGIGLAGAVIDRSGSLIVTFSNGVSQSLGQVVGRDGAPGAPGQDGRGFDDLEILHDGERTFTFRLAREGAEAKEWRYTVPAQIYRGVYREGEQYERGDTVTYSSSLWHCNAPTTARPEDKSPDWMLAVKRGQDGPSAYAVAQRNGFTGTQKEWLDSMRGPPGAPGRPGKDLTQVGPDGAKW